MSTPFMGLDLPSPLVTPGPTWASLLNTALDAIDAHDHTAGQGVPITPAAMNINADLDLQSHGLQTAKLVNLATNAAALATPSILHSVNGDLVWINANGTAVPITSGNSVVGSPGSIQNLVSPASAQYSAADSAFRWFSGSGVMAGLDIGFAIFRQAYGSTSPALSMRAPTAGATTWTWTLPGGPGGSPGGMLVVLPSGVSEYWYPDSGATLESVGTVLRVKDLGITTAKLANAPNGVTTAKINDSSITTAKIADSNVTTAKIADSNVTTVKIADSNVTTTKIADSNVTAAKIADLNVTTAKLADLSVTNAKIADYTITGAKIAGYTVNTYNITDGAISSGKILNNAVDSTKIIDSAIVNSKIYPLAVTSDKIADGAVTALKTTTLSAFGGNGFSAANSLLQSNDTPSNPAYLICTTPTIALASYKNFRCTLQPPDSSGAFQLFGMNVTSTGGISVYVRVRIWSGTTVVRSYTTSTLMTEKNGTVYFPTSIQVPTVVDYVFSAGNHFATAEIWCSALSSVNFWLNYVTLSLTQL